jgi:hypothetical protein
METIVTVALMPCSGMVVLDAEDDRGFCFVLSCESYDCRSATSYGAATPSDETIAGRAIVLGKMNVRVDATWCNVTAFRIDNLRFRVSREKCSETGYFSI